MRIISRAAAARIRALSGASRTVSFFTSVLVRGTRREECTCRHVLRFESLRTT